MGGRAVGQRGHVERRQQLQRERGQDAADRAHPRQHDLVIAVAQRDRRAAQDLVAGQVGRREQAAVGRLVVKQRPGQRAAAGIGLPLAGQRGQRIHQVGDEQPLLGLDKPTVGGKNAPDTVGMGIERGQQAAGVGLESPQGHAVARQPQGRFQEHVERQAAVVGRQSAQPGDIARNGHRAAPQIEALRRRAEVDGHFLEIECGGRRPVQPRHNAEKVVDAGIARPRVIQLRDAAAAQMNHTRLGDERHEGGGHGRVGGIAAPAQHLGPGGGRLSVSGGDHSSGHNASSLLKDQEAIV